MIGPVLRMKPSQGTCISISEKGKDAYETLLQVYYDLVIWYY